ncbi:MAG: MarR family winged helix-turn-helix transcriptional regulator [Flavobacteriaceae bacterium]
MNKQALNVDFDNSIAPWLGKTVKIVEYFLHEELIKRGLDLSKEQMIVLKKLHEQNGRNQNELAFLTLRNKSSLTRLLSKMEKKKYIIRRQSEEDRRVNHVFITELGREVYVKTRPVIQKLIATMEHNISEEEIDQMIRTLKKIQYNFTSQEAYL